MNRIIIEAVPQSAMRPQYAQEPEGGDWFIDEYGDLVIRVIGDDFDNPKTFLFAFHELAEAMLCRRDGVSQHAVDVFDAGFKGEREPGDDPASPYRRQHRFACLVEFLMAHELGIDGYGRIE